jgi:hypothetical protein
MKNLFEGNHQELKTACRNLLREKRWAKHEIGTNTQFGHIRTVKIKVGREYTEVVYTLGIHVGS